MAFFSRFFDPKPGKGVTKRKITDKERYGFIGFLIAFKNNFWKLITLNLIYLLTNFPIIFLIIALTGILKTPSLSPTNTVFAPLYGAFTYSSNPLIAPVLGVYGTQVTHYVENNITMLMYGLSIILVLTYGLSNAGMTYILRGLVRGDTVFVWSDYWGAIKKNLLRGFLTGLLDAAIICMLVFLLLFYNYYSMDFMSSLMYIATLAVTIVYIIMKFYIYLILITFDLKFIKVIKNSLIFVMLGVKRNVAALLGVAAVIIINLLLLMFMPSFGLVMPFILTVSAASFITAFAAYANIKKHMIDPYYEEHPEKRTPNPHSDVIFIDRG